MSGIYTFCHFPVPVNKGAILKLSVKFYVHLSSFESAPVADFDYH
jgi:hypothetical protein